MEHDASSIVLFIMGVSGAGKTTVGKAVAAITGLPFLDADDFHPVQNVEKMKAGSPLTDEDREEWLATLNSQARRCQEKHGCIIACSALKKKYRTVLEEGLYRVKWVYLRGSSDLVEDRLKKRKGHFMPAALLRSQLDILEEPGPEALVIDISNTLPAITGQVVSFMGTKD